jgi:hypothetical protein
MRGQKRAVTQLTAGTSVVCMVQRAENKEPITLHSEALDQATTAANIMYWLNIHAVRAAIRRPRGLRKTTFYLSCLSA